MLMWSESSYWKQRNLWFSPLFPLVLATVPDRHFGSGLGPNWTVAKLAVRVINKPELPTRVLFLGKLPTRLNWARCPRVAQRVHLEIHIRLLYLQCVNSILSKSRFQQTLISFGLLSSLQYQLIWYLCFTFDIWYFWQARQSIIQFCARKSARCLHYKICKSWNC